MDQATSNVLKNVMIGAAAALTIIAIVGTTIYFTGKTEEKM